MKIKTLFLALSLSVSIIAVETIQAEAPVQTQNSRQLVTLDVHNMTCAVCPITIKKALQSVDGVQKALVELDTKTASVTFDPRKTNPEALIKATTHAGFPATIRQSK
ncbi:MAG: cation transporter [Methylococcales bacterium]